MNSGIPRDLETICLKCLQQSPARRYASAQELAEDLARFQQDLPIRARPIGMLERAVKRIRRRPAVACLAAAIFVTCLAAAGVVAHERGRSARDKALIQVEAHLVAPAAAVPYTLENLRAAGDTALPHLQQVLADPSRDEVQRLHAAYAIADQGHIDLDFLIDRIATAPGAECPNLVASLATARNRVVPRLSKLLKGKSETNRRFRYAATLLYLGDPTASRNLLAFAENPVDRTAWIESFATWLGDLQPLPELLSSQGRSWQGARGGPIPGESSTCMAEYRNGAGIGLMPPQPMPRRIQRVR